MSYILDALKKSDQQRQLHTRTKEKQRWQISDAPVRKRKSIWLPVSVLVVGSVAVSSWLNDAPSDKAPKAIQEFVPVTDPPETPVSSDKGTAGNDIVSVNTERNEVETQAAPLKLQPNLASPELLKKKQGQLREQMLSYQKTVSSTQTSVSKDKSPPEVSPGLIESETDSAVTNTAVVSQTAEEVQVAEANHSEASRSLEAEPEQLEQPEQISTGESHALALSVLHLSELPPSVVRQLPRFDVSVSIFSQLAVNRRARINGQMYYQGDSLTEKLKLYEITPKALIFDFEGQLFRVSL